jgi:hypothetical protein
MQTKRSAFKSTLALTLGAATLLALPACTPGKQIGDIGGQFWQRTSSSDALYLRGPKAQQMLNRDISRCVTELRELERLGAVKNAIPTDISGHVLRQDELDLADWDSPERDKHLFAEHSDYQDFEGCMQSKGWERIEHVPYEVGAKGRENYLKAHVDYRHDDNGYSPLKPAKQSTQTQGDYGDLNQFSAGGRGLND